MTREELKEEFVKLRMLEYPKNKYGRARYYDYMIDMEVLAEAKTDDELENAIKLLKKIYK